MRVLFEDFALDLESRQLFRAGCEVQLGPKAFDFLALLVRERPRALSKAHLRDSLWPRTSVADSNLTSLMADLRSALDDDAKSPLFVRTVHGFGYAFCAVVRDAPEPGRPAAKGSCCRLLVGDREVALDEGENVLGRSREARVWIDSSMVSRRHARILVRGGEATLEDLESRNGTSLGGQRVDGPVALTDGDEVLVGGVLLVFRSLSSEESTDAEPPGKARGERRS
jgi:DNA-binding winged helix-turn-helix (wHTH) protein